ncbi:unnamed protein product, partial [Strongylus vulgaris]
MAEQRENVKVANSRECLSTANQKSLATDGGRRKVGEGCGGKSPVIVDFLLIGGVGGAEAVVVLIVT